MELPELQSRTVPDLLRMHAEYDKQILEIRTLQSLIDAEVHRKEKATERPGRPELTQKVDH